MIAIKWSRTIVRLNQSSQCKVYIQYLLTYVSLFQLYSLFAESAIIID